MFASDHLGRRLPFWQAAWWCIRRPLATLVFATLLIAHGCSQPPGTIIGDIANCMDRCCWCGSRGLFQIHRKDGVLSVSADLDTRDESFAGHVWYRPRRFTGGIWSPTTTGIDHHVSIILYDGEPTSDERAQIIASLASELATYDSGSWAAYAPIVAAGGGTVSTPIYAGHIQNLVPLTLASLLVASCWWIPTLTRDQIRANRRGHDLCIHCTYDLRTLPPGPCPECGRSQNEP